MDGLSKFEAWLSKIPTPDGEKQPSLALRKGLFEILADIRVKREQIVPA